MLGTHSVGKLFETSQICRLASLLNNIIFVKFMQKKLIWKCRVAGSWIKSKVNVEWYLKTLFPSNKPTNKLEKCNYFDSGGERGSIVHCCTLFLLFGRWLDRWLGADVHKRNPNDNTSSVGRLSGYPNYLPIICRI